MTFNVAIITERDRMRCVCKDNNLQAKLFLVARDTARVSPILFMRLPYNIQVTCYVVMVAAWMCDNNTVGERQDTVNESGYKRDTKQEASGG